MSDFLSNLAARSLAPAAEIQPRRASRFEPRPAAAPALDSAPIELELEHTPPEQPRPSAIRADGDPAEADWMQRGERWLDRRAAPPSAARADRAMQPSEDAPDRRVTAPRPETVVTPPTPAAAPPHASAQATPAALRQAAEPIPAVKAELPAAQPLRPAANFQPMSRSELPSRPTIAPSRADDPAHHADPLGQTDRRSSRDSRPFAPDEMLAPVAQQPRPNVAPRPPADRAADSSPTEPASRPLVTPRAEPVRPQITRRAAPPTPQPPAPTPPAIQVTIGRIEVRATPATSQPKPGQRSGPAVMTIEEYLRQRTEGGSR